MNLFFRTITVCAFMAAAFSHSLAESAKIRFDSYATFSAKSEIQPKWICENKPAFVDINNTKVLRNVFGISASIKIELPQKFQTESWDVSFVWAPYNSCFAWPDGQLLAVNTKNGILTLETLRRGRLGLKLNNKLLACSPWLNWGHQTFKKVSLIKQGNSIFLFVDDVLKITTSTATVLQPLSIDIATPKAKPMLCSGGYWKSFEISNQVVLPVTSDILSKQIEVLKNRPYRFTLLKSKKELVDRLEKFRTISADKIADKNLKAQLTVLQVAWDAWLSRMNCRDWDKWELKHPGSKMWFTTALVQLEKMADEIGVALKNVKPVCCGKKSKQPVDSGPWVIRDGRIFRDGKAELYQGFIGWTMGYAVGDVANMGGNLLSISIWPEMLYGNDGKFREDKWQEVVVRTMAAAKANNVAVDVLITAYPTTAMAKANPAWGKTCGHSFLKACVFDGKYKKFMTRFLVGSAIKLRDYPALASICIGNELQFDEHCPQAQKRFQNILRNEFKTVGNFNKKFDTKFKSFADIEVGKKDIHKKDMPKWVRYWRKNMWEIGNEHVKELVKICKDHAPGIPLHVKMLPNEFTRPSLKPGSWRWKWKWDHWDFPDGIDRPALVNALDMAGTDSWAAAVHKKSGYDFISEADVMYQQMYYDYLTGIDPGKPIFDSEWHVLNGHLPMPAKQYRRTVWLGVTSGVQAASLWVWHPTIERLTALSQPALLNEVSKFFIELQQRKKLVNELRENRFAPIAMIYDHHLCRENQNGYITAMLSVYRQLVFMGRRPMILDTRNLKNRPVPKNVKAIVYMLPPKQTQAQVAIKSVPAIYVTWSKNWQGPAEIDSVENILDARDIFNSEKEGEFNLKLLGKISNICPGIKNYKPVHGVVPLKDSAGKLSLLINNTIKEKTVPSHKLKLEPFEVHFVKAEKTSLPVAEK